MTKINCSNSYTHLHFSHLIICKEKYSDVLIYYSIVPDLNYSRNATKM